MEKTKLHFADMVAADRAWNAITPSLRSVLFGLYYIQYCLLVYTSFLASAHLQLKHFPLLFFLERSNIVEKSELSSQEMKQRC